MSYLISDRYISCAQHNSRDEAEVYLAKVCGNHPLKVTIDFYYKAAKAFVVSGDKDRAKKILARCTKKQRNVLMFLLFVGLLKQ